MDYTEHVRIASRLLQNEWARGNTGAVVDHLTSLNKIDFGVVLLNFSSGMSWDDEHKLMRLLIIRSDLCPGHGLQALARAQRLGGLAATTPS